MSVFNPIPTRDPYLTSYDIFPSFLPRTFVYSIIQCLQRQLKTSKTYNHLTRPLTHKTTQSLTPRCQIPILSRDSITHPLTHSHISFTLSYPNPNNRKSISRYTRQVSHSRTSLYLPIYSILFYSILFFYLLNN